MLEVESIRLEKRSCKQRGWNFKPYMAQIRRRSHALLTDLVDIERELRSYVRMGIFVISHQRTVFFCELRKFIRYGRIYGSRMPDCVTDVMRECTDCKREFIGVLGFLEQDFNEVR